MDIFYKFSPVISTILSQNIPLSTLFSHSFNLRFLSMSVTKFHTQTQQTARLYFCMYSSL